MSNTSANFTIGYKPNDSHHNLLNGQHEGHDSQTEEYIYFDNSTGEYLISGPDVQYGTLRVVPKSEGSSESGGLSATKSSGEEVLPGEQASSKAAQPKKEVQSSKEGSEDERVGYHPDTTDPEEARGKGERAARALHDTSRNALMLCGAGKWICGVGARRKQEKERRREARDRMLHETGYYI